MEIIFYTFCAYLPIHLVAYLPFFDMLRFGKGWMAATVAGNIFLHLSGVCLVLSAGRPDLVYAISLVMVPISLVLYFVNIKLAPSKLLFTYVLLVNYQIIVIGIASYLTATVVDAPVQSWEGGLISLALFGAAWLPMYRLFRYAAQQVYRIHAPQLWHVIWLIPAIMSVLVTIFTGGGSYEAVESWQFLFARTGLLLCVVVVYWVLLRSLEGVQKQAVLEEQLHFETHLLQIQVVEQKKHSALLVENAERLRRQRHDLRHQLTVIRGLANADNIPLIEYIDSLIQDIPAAPKRYCENPAVNAIVSYYDTLCQTQDIAFTAQLLVPELTEQASDSELCVLFGNLLENAVEACCRMTEEKRFIRLQCQLHYSMLTIYMHNSFDGQVHMDNGKYRSSKRDDFGVGLSSIQAVARKNHGDAWFESDGQVFRSWVHMQL